MSTASRNTRAAAPKAKQARVSGKENVNVSVTKRLQTELMSLMTNSPPGCSAFPDEDNIFKWKATITGSDDTVYAGLVYKLNFSFPPTYPYTAPTVTFETPCFHPNVDDHGNICLDVLKDKWSAILNVRTVLLSIQSLLGEPNNESPLNGYAAALWPNQAEYEKTLRKKYEDHAKLSEK